MNRRTIDTTPTRLGAGLYVRTINLRLMMALLSNYEEVPITRLYDSDGGFTQVLDDCVIFVAGSFRWGWYTGRCDDFVVPLPALAPALLSFA